MKSKSHPPKKAANEGWYSIVVLLLEVVMKFLIMSCIIFRRRSEV